MNMAVSDISLRPRCLTEVVSCREDGWNPEADEYAGFVAGAHVNTEPKGNGKKERRESRRKYEPISFGEHFICLCYCSLFVLHSGR